MSFYDTRIFYYGWIGSWYRSFYDNCQPASAYDLLLSLLLSGVFKQYYYNLKEFKYSGERMGRLSHSTKSVYLNEIFKDQMVL